MDDQQISQTPGVNLPSEPAQLPKKNLTPKFIILIVGVLLIGGLTYGAVWWQQQSITVAIPSFTQRPSLTPQISNVIAPASYAWCMANGGKDETPNYNAPRVCVLENRVYQEYCVSNDKYFVISPDNTGVGAGILIKYKSSNSQIIPCE